MKRILWGLLALCVSCSHSVKKEPKPTEWIDAAIKTSSHVGAMLDAERIEPKALAATTPGKLFGMSAASTEPYLGWVKASIGFAKGETTEAGLQDLGPDYGLMYSWRVLTTWDDGSVRVAQIKTPAYFDGMGLVPVNLVHGKTPKPYFNWHPSVLEAIVANKFATQYKIRVQVGDAPNTEAVECTPASGAWKILTADATELTIRFRSHCYAQATLAARPLSMTSYFTFMSDDPVVRIENILGNDTLETPTVSIGLNNVTVDGGNLPPVRWVNLASYGNKSAVLADGQTMAFKTVLALDPAFDSTAAHIATGEPMGFQLWQDMVASQAFGSAPLPATRVPAALIQQIHAQMNSQAALSAQPHPKTYLGMINLNPPATGAQPDFASTMPADLQKAAQSYSSKFMAGVLLASYRESYRPSFWWETRNGVEDRVKNTSYPDLFFWSSYPHYDRSWNMQYPQWHSRTAWANWPDQGPYRGGWGSADNQHTGNNTLRYAWLLTGNHVIGDWLQYYISIIHFNWLTDWLFSTEAERAVGRSTKEIVALVDMFKNTPEAQLAASRIPAKLEAQRNALTQTMNQFGMAAANMMNACDPRVNQSGGWPICQYQTPETGNIAVSGWQTGFVQELWSMLPNPDLRMLAQAERYFLPDGTPKTYFRVMEPGDYKTGGIGIEWWSGWVQVAQKNPTAPGAAFVLNTVKPVLDERQEHGCGFPSPYFCLNDSFHAW